MHIGDNITIGNVEGSNISIKARDVRQTIGSAPAFNNNDKETLDKLIGQLETALNSAPPAKASEAEAVLTMLKSLIEEVSKQKPNKTMISVSANGLKEAAETLKAVVPAVLTISGQIVSHILKTTGV